MGIPESKTSLKNLFPITKIGEVPIIDFWNAYQLVDDFRSQSNLFDTYKTTTGERWDLIAEQVYGDRELWWVIVLFNNIEDPFSLYYELDIDNSIKSIILLKEQYMDMILNAVRERLIEFSKKGKL